ncbi:MAG: family 65 glycosyl hydrolase domain-containing protein [Bacteroidales bacterium]
MRQYLKADPWRIIEEGFDPANQRSSESIFSLGNGHMGQRANFEETYGGSSLQGTYIAGVYYTDKTRVGWWKNGYPEYFAKVLNAPSWNGVGIQVNGEELDLANCRVSRFVRILDMKEGLLERTFVAQFPDGKEIEVAARRFISMDRKEIAAIRYSVTPLNFSGKVTFTSSIDGNVRNQDANYDELFWNILDTKVYPTESYLLAETRKTGFRVGFGVKYQLTVDGAPASLLQEERVAEADRAYNRITVDLKEGEEAVFYKYVAVVSSLNEPVDKLITKAMTLVADAASQGFGKLFDAHKKRWESIWKHADIAIAGDTEAQQGIRFNIFHLNQTYTGDDARLNIGPKGFTGEKYGGSTYWDTEAYCLPFYLSTASSEIARNLLVYRYKQLDKAIENGAKLGFTDGAALFPMVTMNGEECHNEWEITFEEIHRNGAIAYAIEKFIRYTGDDSYLREGGLEVLIGIARFWAQRITWSEERGKYVMLGVTGPNEYENNVNNNWYTSKIAAWCMRYAIESLERVKQEYPEVWETIVAKTGFDATGEPEKWQHIIDHLYLPEDTQRGIFLQQDGYLDKEQMLARDLNPAQRPINQHWSWDRILRSCFIKQADVLQGIYFFEDEYDTDTIRRNYEFYEPRTVHESSLSPCIHSILAARIGEPEQAYRLYLRTSRLDLDDYNNEAHEGLHITSMAGTWLSVVEGFGGMRVKDNMLCFQPSIPDKWRSFSFKTVFRGNTLQVTIDHFNIIISNEEGPDMQVCISGKQYPVAAVSKLHITY